MLKKMVYLSILLSLISANVLSIDLVFMQLSLFRISLLFTLLLVILNIAKKGYLSLTKLKQEKAIQFFLIWFIYSIISVIWVKDYSAWLKYGFFLGSGLIGIIIINEQLITRNHLLAALKYFSVMIIIHNLIGWFEIFGGTYFFLQERSRVFYEMEKMPVSMFGNANDYATFLLLSMSILYILMRHSRNKVLKLIYATTFLSSTVLIILTKSRANMIGIAVWLITLVLLNFRKSKTKLALVIMIFCVIIILIAYPSVFTNLVDFNFIDVQGSEVIRVNLLLNGFDFFISTFGFGVGAGNIEYWMQNYGVRYTRGVTNIHNWWFEILVANGVIIFIGYMNFYVDMIIKFYRKFKRSLSLEDKTISLGFLCSLFSFIIGSISSSSIISSEWLWMYWGILIAFKGLPLETRKNKGAI